MHPGGGAGELSAFERIQNSLDTTGKVAGDFVLPNPHDAPVFRAQAAEVALVASPVGAEFVAPKS